MFITSPTSASSSTDTPQSPQIQFQPPSNIPLPLLSTVTSPCTPTFPFSPTPTAYSLFSALPSTSCHHLVPHHPSKVLPATPDSSLHVMQHVTEEVQISPAVPHVACGLMHVNLLAKTTTKLLFVCIIFLLFLITTLNFYLVFCIFLGRFSTLCMKTHYTVLQFTIYVFWESPSGDFDSTVFLVYIIHAYYAFFEWHKGATLKMNELQQNKLISRLYHMRLYLAYFNLVACDLVRFHLIVILKQNVNFSLKIQSLTMTFVSVETLEELK